MEEFAEFILMIGMAVVACVVLVQMASSVTSIVLGVKTASKDKSSAFLGYSLILLAASQMISILSSVPANMIKVRLMTENTVRMFNYLSIATTDKVHDRYLIIDTMEMYHIGASVKDAGRKTFEISENKDGRYLDMILERLNT